MKGESVDIIIKQHLGYIHSQRLGLTAVFNNNCVS